MSKVIVPECKDVGGMKDEIYISNEKKDRGIGLLSRLLRFDTLGKKSSTPESPTAMEPSTTYYGVYIPCEIKKGPDEEALHVYNNKAKALELVRQYKTARFKAFTNRTDALSFALRGAEPVDTTDGHDNSLMGEKPYPFKAPSPQEMVCLRKAIEAGRCATVRERVWDNPRYLVSSGNTPAILQEGSRYNAMHIAAKAKDAEISNLILTTVGDPDFVHTLYGGDADPEACKEFASILLDRYLNTPDKAMNETPLHFAAKFGADAVVDVLTSFPQCDRDALNKFGERPQDVVCRRVAGAPPQLAARVAALLRERYYVPVLHAEDGSGAPAVGRAFSLAHPPEINQDPLSPRYEIRAFAGPMPGGDAESFRRRWRTPPRAAPPAPRTFRLREITKGLETVGRTLAEEMKVDWKEYWPFLDTFTDLRTAEGLALLEEFLRDKRQRACQLACSLDLSESRPSLPLSRCSPASPSALSPMSELCVAMNTCKITADTPPHWRKTDPVRQRLCRQPTAKAIPNGNSTFATNHTVSQLLCIERTCQVFAKRIAAALIFSLTAEPEVAGESLKSEAKHLQHTMFSYMDDERFQKIDFALIHSRLAQLVVFNLKEQTDDIDDVNTLVEFLMKLRCPNDDIFSSDDERKSNYRMSRLKLSHVIDNHVRCVAGFISEELTEEGMLVKPPAVSEIECAGIWEKAEKCRCDWKTESFERNSKKNASFRKNRSILSTSPKTDNFLRIRRLNFYYDMGDGQQQGEEGAARCEGAGAAAARGGGGGGDASACVALPEISDDDSPCNDSDEEAYHTASEHEERDDDESEQFADASDRAIVEPFIYGEEPTKMDRLVYDAICGTHVDVEQYPNVYLWRHTVALYPPHERDSWAAVTSGDESVCNVSLSVWSPRCAPPSPGAPSPAAASSPLARRAPSPAPARDSRALPLQVSSWLRVTGPNTPRSALASKNVSHNVSFGF